MTQTVELSHAECHLAELVQKAGAGAEIVITQGGRPIAKLVAATESPPSREAGSAKGFVVPDDFDAPLDDFRDYMSLPFKERFA